MTQNVLDAKVIELTEELVVHILESLNEWNLKELPSEIIIEGIRESGSVDYPRDDNDIPNAVIHSTLQGKDYEELKPGSPLFESIDGQMISYEGRETVFPIFINEAAYYEKKIALRIGKKTKLKIN